jgi:hypothetical protein
VILVVKPFGVIGVLLGTALLASGVLADTNQATERTSTIQVFQSPSAFSESGRVGQTISFDDLGTGVSLGNPALLGPVNIAHSTASTFKTIGTPPYFPTSLPNVLAPVQADNTLGLGDTTLTFGKNRRAVGLFLVLPQGSNQDAVWTSTVTATDTKGESVIATVLFRGVIGEQQFIGFRSQHKLMSITFGPAAKVDASSVLALDDVMVD